MTSPTLPSVPGAAPAAPADAALANTAPDRQPDPGAASASRRRVPSVELFRGAIEVEIIHREQVYRLRQTALGKLILTK